MKGDNLDFKELKSQTMEIIETYKGKVHIYNIQKLKNLGFGDINRLPFTHRILVENILRNLDGHLITMEQLNNLMDWNAKSDEKIEIAYLPSRV